MLESVSYDETPMICNVRDPHAQQLLHSLSSKLEGTEEENTLAQMQHVLGKGKNDPVVSKLLQSRSRYGIIIETDPHKYVLVLGDTLTHPQSMGRANASCLVACLIRAGTLPLASRRFHVQCRASTSDKAGYNLLAEHILQEQRGAACCSFKLSCDAHSLATCVGKTLGSLCGGDVQGLLRSALSLQVGTYMCTFRTALAQVVKSKLIFCKGTLPREAMKYKEHVLNLFHSTLSYRSKKVCLLLRVMNGDWRDHKNIQYYTDKVDSLTNEDLVVQWMTSVLLEVYLCRKPFVYPRHRWTGADRSLDWVGSLESCHGLFTATYTHFLKLLAKPTTSRNADSLASVNAQVSDPVMDDHATIDADLPVLDDGDLDIHHAYCAGSHAGNALCPIPPEFARVRGPAASHGM